MEKKSFYKRHKFLTIFTIAVVFVSIGNFNEMNKKARVSSGVNVQQDLKREISSQEWYEGGNLHQKTLNEWSKSNYENRLATSADFVVKLTKSLDKMKAVALEKCISEVAMEKSVNNQKVASVGANCFVLLKF